MRHLSVEFNFRNLQLSVDERRFRSFNCSVDSTVDIVFYLQRK